MDLVGAERPLRQLGDRGLRRGRVRLLRGRLRAGVLLARLLLLRLLVAGPGVVLVLIFGVLARGAEESRTRCPKLRFGARPDASKLRSPIRAGSDTLWSMPSKPLSWRARSVIR